MGLLNNKRTYQLVGTGLVGILLGGLGAGFADMHRSNPFFSFASGGMVTECQATIQQIENLVSIVNEQQRPIPSSQWDSYQADFDRLEEAIPICVHAICDPQHDRMLEAHEEFTVAFNAWREAHRRAVEVGTAADDYNDQTLTPALNAHNAALEAYETASAAFDAAENAYNQYYDSLPDDVTPKQLERLNQLEAEMDRLGAEVERLVVEADRLLDAYEIAEAHYNELVQQYEALVAEEEASSEEADRLAAISDQLRHDYDDGPCEESFGYDAPEFNPNTSGGNGYTSGGSGFSAGRPGNFAQTTGVPSKAAY